MKMKDDGNKAMAAGEYVKWVNLYTDGLDQVKDIKALWTNKWLAEIKIYRYEDAVQSWGRVLELCEIFEDGFEKSRDLWFKAFCRR